MNVLWCIYSFLAAAIAGGALRSPARQAPTSTCFSPAELKYVDCIFGIPGVRTRAAAAKKTITD